MKPCPMLAPLLACAFLSAVSPGAVSATATPQGYSGIFGGGPLYITSKGASANITELENSGFTEVIVWSVEVKPNGDLNLNGEFPLTAGGAYVGGQTYPDFASDMARLKQGKVRRVTFSIGSSNFGDWQDIAALVRSQGTGPDSILYRTFAALKAAIPAIDAIDFDDENSFDLATTVQFGVMLGQLGYRVMPDPYFDAPYWKQVVSQINAQSPDTVDGVHLQTYAGGSGNSPCHGWDFGAVPVFPLVWDADDTPMQTYRQMHAWHAECGIVGGGIWLYDDLVGTGEAAKYAKAVNRGVK
jgi:hypothetical protein